MKYKYAGNGAYLQGLPARDLEDENLNESQKALLEMAVAMKMYEAEAGPKPASAPRKETPKNDDKP